MSRINTQLSDFKGWKDYFKLLKEFFNSQDLNVSQNFIYLQFSSISSEVIGMPLRSCCKNIFVALSPKSELAKHRWNNLLACPQVTSLPSLLAVFLLKP